MNHYANRLDMIFYIHLIFNYLQFMYMLYSIYIISGGARNLYLGDHIYIYIYIVCVYEM